MRNDICIFFVHGLQIRMVTRFMPEIMVKEHSKSGWTIKIKRKLRL